VRIGSVKRSERVAVIGVGILGASVGWNLSRHGAKVVFIDAGRPGEGVTNWSFSWRAGRCRLGCTAGTYIGSPTVRSAVVRC
jgi:glycine/D-amino acid oxidase-like deaminating enzyme